MLAAEDNAAIADEFKEVFERFEMGIAKAQSAQIDLEMQEQHEAEKETEAN